MDSNVPTTVSREERNWAMLAHLSGLLSATGIGGLVAAFVIWLLRRDENNFASEQAREALNFQITIFICFLVAWLLQIVLIGFLLYGIVVILDVIFSIVGAVKTSEGIPYRYPFNLRLVS